MTEYIKESVWLEHPELYFPEPRTLTNCMKWHLALKTKINERHRALNPSLYEVEEDGFPRITSAAEWESAKTDPELDAMQERDRDFILGLGYTNVALIEAAILVGRDIWYKNHRGHAACIEDDLLDQISLSDVIQWAAVYNVPLTEREGGNLARAYEYAFGKNIEFLQSYVDKLTEQTRNPRRN